MPELNYESKKWKELGISDKVKITIAGSLVTASIILGFVSFIILLEIPTSVIGLDGLWLSTALAILGIGSYFHNEMIKFEAKVNTRLHNLNKNNNNNKDELLDN